MDCSALRIPEEPGSADRLSLEVAGLLDIRAGHPAGQGVVLDRRRRRFELPASLRSDPEWRKFESLLSAQGDPPNVICIQCPKYRVWAEFKGRLDVSPNTGLIKDPKTGKQSIEGYGHP